MLLVEDGLSYWFLDVRLSKRFAILNVFVLCISGFKVGAETPNNSDGRSEVQVVSCKIFFASERLTENLG